MKTTDVKIALIEFDGNYEYCVLGVGYSIVDSYRDAMQRGLWSARLDATRSPTDIRFLTRPPRDACLFYAFISPRVATVVDEGNLTPKLFHMEARLNYFDTF